MKNVEDRTNSLINAIRESHEFKEYQVLLKNVMQDQALYDKINEIRRKSLALQFSNHLNLIEESDKLYSEYEEILCNPLVIHFFSAEQVYRKMTRDMNDKIMGSLDIDIGFLEDSL